MCSRTDYKKRLMEYRKSIGATNLTNLKTVAFKEPSSHSDEDIQLCSPHPPAMQTLYNQQYHHQLALHEDELISDSGRSALRELSFSSTPSPLPQSQSQMLPTLELLHRTGNLLSEPFGQYTNWNSQHALLASQPWCRIGDLMGFCDKYEFKAISVSDVQTHANIVREVKEMLNGSAPFDKRQRFPDNVSTDGNLLVCIGRCPSIEYHLQRILSIFRRPLNKLSTDKQNIAKQNFHITIRELHLDISARITEVRLYDRVVFEKEFRLNWLDSLK